MPYATVHVLSDPADQPLRFGRFEISPAERLLRVDGEPVVLGARAFDLLLTLAQRRDRVVAKQELLDLVWPGVVVEEHNITAQISTLRKLLGAGVIATVPGRGYQFTAVLVPGASSMPADVAPSSHNLPDQRTRFIGREDALADLAQLLPSTRLLTLIGIGGCGKTRLAIELAHHQRAAFPDGVWFVDLGPLHDAARVASTCAGVFGIRGDDDPQLIEGLVRHLAARRVLLVLDNCEHVIAGVVALVEALFAGTTTIVATSREALGIRGEQIYPVRSLSLPSSAELEAVLGAEAVRVFVDRARLALPDFAVDGENAASVVEICRRLDGIALAIELAAARVTMLPVTEIAERLDDRFRLLTGGSRALPRHQTLNAAMQWSYEQLAPEAQRMLRLVSVFAGGWTLRGAADVAQIADEYEALALLTVLHDKSLLVVDRDAHGRRPRYRMLETVRQYAMDRLNESGEAATARGRHVAHYVALAETAEPRLDGAEQDVWLARLRQEHEDLIAALRWCCDSSEDPQSGLRLAAATTVYWIWNSVELGHRLAVAVLEHDRAATDTSARAGTLNAIARLDISRGRYEDALTYSEQAVAVARRIGAARPLASTLLTLGAALNTLGRTEQSTSYHEEALGLARELDDQGLIANLLNSIAESKRSEGQLETAERCYREALEVTRTHGGRLARVVILNNLIRVLVARRRLDHARVMALECLPLVRNEKVSVDLLEAAVGLASALGAHVQAARFWGVADQTLLGWGYRHQPVDIAHHAPLLASSREAIGDPAFAAAEALGRAQALDGAIAELEHWLTFEIA